MKTILDEVEEQAEIRGEQRGKREGELKGKLEVVREGLAFKYPNHPSELDENLGKITQIDQLDAIRRLVYFETKPLEEIIRFVKGFLTPPNSAPRIA